MGWVVENGRCHSFGGMDGVDGCLLDRPGELKTAGAVRFSKYLDRKKTYLVSGGWMHRPTPLSISQSVCVIGR